MNDHFPLDFDALKKGDVIPCEQVEKIYQVNHITDIQAFQLRALALSKQISDERPDLLARVDGNSVRIMTDIEAEEWTHTQTRKAVACIARNAKRRAIIDRSEFSPEHQKIAESRDRAITALALFTKKELARARREELLLAASSAKEAAE